MHKMNPSDRTRAPESVKRAERRWTERAIKAAARHGCDPYNSAEAGADYWARFWRLGGGR